MGIFDNLLSATVKTALLPVGLVIDVITSPAIIACERESTTLKIGREIVKHVEKASESNVVERGGK